MTLRTEETNNAYTEYRKGLKDGECPLCDKEPLRLFTHWKIVENLFPYDRIASKHDMIVSPAHKIEKELSLEELAELEKIKEEFIHREYQFIIEATYPTKTIPFHFHLHLVNVKK